MPVTLFPVIVAAAGVVPICDQVPPAGLGDKVILVANVFVAAFTQTKVVSFPALGLAFTVTTTFAVSLQPAAFWATNTYVVVEVGFTEVGVVTAVPLAVPTVQTGL